MEYKVYYYFGKRIKNTFICSMTVRATDKYQAIAKVQKLYNRENLYIINAIRNDNAFWYKIKNKERIKVFYKCSNCGHCVSNPAVKCSGCGASMSIWKEI